MARMNQTVSEIIAEHDGVRPVEQGEGDSFVAAFARASDAVAARWRLQRAPLAPIRLRIGVHTGEIQLRDEGNYAGPTINRTARLRDLGHGGQTLMSGVTEALGGRPATRRHLVDRSGHPRAARSAPPGAGCSSCAIRTWSTNLRHCASLNRPVSQHLPMQLTNFIGRADGAESGAGAAEREPAGDVDGCGRRGQDPAGHTDRGSARRRVQRRESGMWIWRRSPTPSWCRPQLARAFGLPDQPGRSTMDTLTRFIADRQMLVVLDNCEHLLDASAALAVALLGACPGLTLLGDEP